MAALIAPLIVTAGAAMGVSVSIGVATFIGHVVALGISMALASALRPNLGDVSIAGQGQALKTSKTNVGAVPVVYGENRLAGNIIWQASNDYNGGTKNKDYWAIVAISDGYAHDFLTLRADEYEMDSTTEDIHTLDYQHIRTYDTSGTGTNVADVDFVTASSGNTEPGSTVFGTTPVIASSNGSSSFKLVDGDLNTWWQPATTTNEWVKIVNNANTPLHSCRLYLPNYGWDYGTAVCVGSVVIKFKVQYSDNGSTWTDASTLYTNSNTCGSSWYNITINTTASHLYWRVLFTEIADYYNSYSAPVFEIDYSTDIAVSITIPSDISYMAVHHLYDVDNNQTLKNITAEIQGKEIDTFSSPAVTPMLNSYNSNPASIVFDIMKTTLNITQDDIDEPSFYAAQQHAITNDLFCNIVFSEKQNTDSAIQAVLATMRGHLSFSNNKWVFIYDAPSTSVDTLTTSDIIENTISISNKPSAETANIITVRYVNPDDEWQVAEVTVQDDALIALDGQDIEQILEVRGCTNQEQATKLAQLTLNQLRYSEDSLGNRINQSPLDIAFTTTIKNAHLESGDVITVQHDLLSFNRKFKIISTETDQSGAISIQAAEYCDTHYEDANGVAIITRGLYFEPNYINSDYIQGG